MNGRFHSGFCDMGEPAPLADPGPQTFRKGQIVFDAKRSQLQPCLVASGEVVIVRDGSAVEIVEAGECLDPSLWTRATAIAWTDCRLISMT